MKLALILAAFVAPFLFAAAIVGVLRIAARESRAEERRPCAFCELRRRWCIHTITV